MNRFVFLELVDARIRDFLVQLRGALSGTTKATPIHITVRGPYSTSPNWDHLEELREKLHGLGVYIGGAGTFETKQGYTVYLKAQSPVFAEIWWKPDYPKEIYSTNPHLTMYETTSKDAAIKVERFLRQERIEIHTFGIELTVRTSKQPDLFDVENGSRLAKLPEFLETLRYKPGIIDRAKCLAASLAGS